MSFLSYIIVFSLFFDIGSFSWSVFKRTKKIEKEDAAKDDIGMERREFIKKIGTRSIFGAAFLGATTGTVKATKVPPIKRVTLKSKKIEKGKKETKDFTFVQLSDLHAGPTIRDSMLEGLSDEITKLKPDLLFLTGDMIDAKKAKQISLINNYFDENSLSKEVNLIAKKITSKSSLTLKIGKKAFYAQSQMNIEDAYKYSSEIMIKNMMEYDAEEGINAFIDKRKPKWK